MSTEVARALPAPEGAPRIVVLRSFVQAKATVAMLAAGRAVLVVVRADEGEGRRILDLLAGWALGAGGHVDRIGVNTLVATPPGVARLRLSRPGMISAVEEAFAVGGPPPLSRDDEQRLVAEAVAGSAQARQRITDAFSELATLFALMIRPASMPEAAAVEVAQAELDRLVTFRSTGPVLASLAEGIIQRLRP